MASDQPYPDQVRWFDALGTCGCGKPATGKLMGPLNVSYGPYCTRCAETRLKKAAAARAAHQGEKNE